MDVAWKKLGTEMAMRLVCEGGEGNGNYEL